MTVEQREAGIIRDKIDFHFLEAIEAMPRKGYQTRSGTAKLFRSFKGRFWRGPTRPPDRESGSGSD